MVNQTGSVPVISKWMATLSKDRLMLGLLVGWCLSGVIQAVAGYGVPVAVCAPLMIAAGFEPLTAAAASLVGHAWAITFGSMGSSFYTLTLSTKIPPEVSGNWVGLTFIMPTVLTGLAVAHIVEGQKGVRKGFFRIVVVGALMGVVQWIFAGIGSAQVAALVGSLAGVGLIAIMSSRERRTENSARAVCPVTAAVEAAGKALEEPESKTSIHVALVPYYALLVVTLISQIGPIKAFFKPYRLGVDYPAMTTSQGYVVQAEKAYAAIGLFSHPAPLITLACLIGVFVYVRRGLIDGEKLRLAWKATVKQSWPTTLGVLTMVMMALVMNDTGMTSEMAAGVARIAGPMFPVVFAVHRCARVFHDRGSNTNSNILFGSFQMETAKALGLSATLIAGSQTAGASLASSMLPAKVLWGRVLRGSRAGRTRSSGSLPYCALVVLMLGIQTLLATWTLTVTP